MSYQHVDMTFFLLQGGKLFFRPWKSSPSRKITKIMPLAYSIKGLSLLTKRKRVGNFLSKWETFKQF